MAVLTAPTIGWHVAWLEAHAEWGPGVHEDGFGLLPGDDVKSQAGFAAWVGRLTDDQQCTYWWIVESDKVLGGIALRHESHPLVSQSGHLGYGIRLSARGKGVATWAVARVVEEAHKLGIDEVLAVCQSYNTASAKTIERQGGILDKTSQESAVLRYWIGTSPPRV
ncbi:GNAT family N-acetyltransferase [Arthrobacter tumbae]|uniref:GNAT family N-acetyltransferase n=1 Tax=Arthrobacter tumbae TaxID=163874 RepID=UPI00195CD66D|nr:GNAT family N-acetyltransferase [Arthrobacter tumbae]MBM7781843.1 putative acetyltransferase [Arthrobacter tumbae]